uniref:Uncharacterized protein n=1 Tax=Anguilla anguilla TaxID=7936 RepID=A0A0E9REK6_ANGAN
MSKPSCIIPTLDCGVNL